MGRWQRYWFADGGRTAVAMLRIAIAVSVLMTLARVDDSVSTYSASLYRPVGIWMLLGHTVPPGALVDVLWVLAWGGTACMLVGLASRASAAVSFVSSVALASLVFSASRTWSHQYNVVFLAQLAFLGARGGDVLSIDWWLRRRRGLPARDEPRAYQWSIRLVQLAVALMFAGAVFHKILHGQFTLRWALSDNLRHHLLMRFDLAGLDRPPLVDWLIDDPLRYRTAAVLNLIAQAMPLAAVFLMRHPWLRALAGSFFVTETIGLGVVVELWNFHWLPLAAVFVDWDRLAAAIRRKPIATPVADPAWRPRRALRIWIIVFVVYEILTAFIPTLDQRLNTYPFSGFPMFAMIRARAPYAEHKPYGVAGDYYEITSDVPVDKMVQQWFDHSNRGAHAIRNPVQLEKRLRAVLVNARKRFPEFGIRGVKLWLTIYLAPAYPEPARFDRHPIAVMGELTPDGTFRTVLGKLDGTSVSLAPRNVDTTNPTLTYYRDDLPTPYPYANKLDGNPVYIVATIDGTPWLAAVHAPWRWQ